MIEGGLREVDSDRRGRVGVIIIYCLFQAANVVCGCATNHTSLVMTGRVPCVSFLNLFVWGLRGTSMVSVLLEGGGGAISRVPCNLS